MKAVSAVFIAGLATGLISKLASATPLLFTIDEGAHFSFMLDSNANPSNVTQDYNLFSDVEVTISAPTFSTKTFLSDVCFEDINNQGGIEITNGYSILFGDTGPQVFSGTLEHPTFTPGVLQLDGGATLTIALSTVPLPSSAPIFGAALLAHGADGYGLKRKAKAGAAA